MRILTMAWRNIWRNRRRTTVTVGAMTLALLALIIYSGLMEGYLRDMERNVIDLELGDLQLHAADYRDNPSIYTRIEETDELLERLDARGYAASARLLGGGLVATRDTSAGALLRGIDRDRDRDISDIHQHVEHGTWLSEDDPRGVVLGRRLARALSVSPGDELVLLSQASDGSMANDLFTVRGVLLGVSDATDRASVFMTAAAFREFFVLPDGTHQVIVRRPLTEELELTATTIAELAPQLDVKTWRQLTPTLASILDSTRGMLQVVFFVVYVVIAILILNAMLMAVFERIREFGVLKAIGVSPGKVFAIIVTESGLQTGLALVIGVVLSLPGLWYLSRVGIDTGALGGMSVMGIAFSSIWYAVVTPYTFIGPVVTLVVLVILAVLYPAFKAARITPVEAMRHH